MVVEGKVKGKPVAVKMLLPGSEKHYLKSLVSELKLLSFLGEHEHIASLVGAYTSQLKYRKNYELYILQFKLFSSIFRQIFFQFRQTLHFSGIVSAWKSFAISERLQKVYSKKIRI